MKSDDHKQAKTDLLRELEALRAQLDNPESEDFIDSDIPLLLDKVEKMTSTEAGSEETDEVSNADIEALQEAYQRATEDLQASDARQVEHAIKRLKEDRQTMDEAIDPKLDNPQKNAAYDQSVLTGQQPLFDKNAPGQQQPKSETARERPTAVGDNPFLPKHIRDRLQERRQKLADDIAQASLFFPTEAPRTGAGSRLSPADRPEHRAVVDALVAKYLPLIEAELRSRLMQSLDEWDSDSSNRPR